MFKRNMNKHTEKNVYLQRQNTDFDKNWMKLQHLDNPSPWIFTILVDSVLKRRFFTSKSWCFATTHFNVCLCSGYLPSLPFTTNADMCMHTLYRQKIMVDVNKQAGDKYSLFNARVVLN